MNCVYLYKHVCGFVLLSLLFVAPCIASDKTLVPVRVEGAGLFSVPIGSFDPGERELVQQKEYAEIAPFVQALIDCHTNSHKSDKNATQPGTPIPAIHVDSNRKAEQ